MYLGYDVGLQGLLMRVPGSLGMVEIDLWGREGIGMDLGCYKMILSI